MTAAIHPTALVSPRAELGRDVVVGPYSIVDEGAVIGDGTELAAYVRVRSRSRLGRRCRLSEHVVVGGDPQDHGYRGELNDVVIGDDVTLREFVTVNRPVGEGALTAVGDHCLLMEGVHVAHNVRIGDNVVIANKVGLAGHVVVEENVTLGGMAGVHQFVHIGRYCMIGGLSKIVKDVPPFVMADGRPARIYGLNRVGLRRNGFVPADRERIRALYERIYHGGLPLREALSRLRGEMAGDPFVEEIVAFAASGSRGLAPWVRSFREGDHGD